MATFWSTLEKNWANFYFIIWSHFRAPTFRLPPHLHLRVEVGHRAEAARDEADQDGQDPRPWADPLLFVLDLCPLLNLVPDRRLDRD